MTTTTEFATIQEAAEHFGAQFELRKRADATEYWARKDTSLPLEEGDSTLEALVVAAHDNREWFPDDVRYKYLVDALDILADCEDENEYYERLDSDVDIYTSDLTAWLHSNNKRVSYLDEAVSEYGAVPNLLNAAQFIERREVFEAVKGVLEELIND